MDWMDGGYITMKRKEAINLREKRGSVSGRGQREEMEGEIDAIILKIHIYIYM